PGDEKSVRLGASDRIERAGIIGGSGLCVDQGNTQRRGSSTDTFASRLFPVVLVTEKGNPRRRWNGLLEHLQALRFNLRADIDCEARDVPSGSRQACHQSCFDWA